MIHRHDYSIDGGRSVLFCVLGKGEGATPLDDSRAIIGTATVVGMHTDRPCIVALHVEPVKRRIGLGAALVRSCIDEARRLSKRLVEVHVHGSNAHALAFYARLGFTRRGLLPNGNVWMTYRIGRDTTQPLTNPTPTG